MTKRFSVNLPEDVYRRVKDVARREVRSMSAILLIAIDRWTSDYLVEKRSAGKPTGFLAELEDE